MVRPHSVRELPQKIIDELSGHSMRVGAAQDMISAGLSVLPIMQAGGWKTINVVGRYVEKANLAALIESRRPYAVTPVSHPAEARALG
jgi:hypothetical protein